MGYDVHITRAEHWPDNEGYQILSEEWLTIVRNYPELIPAPENGPHFVVWRGARKYPETWFNWQAGNVETKYPDKPTLQKMLQIAKCLFLPLPNFPRFRSVPLTHPRKVDILLAVSLLTPLRYSDIPTNSVDESCSGFSEGTNSTRT